MDDSSKSIELHVYIGGPSHVDGEAHSGIMADIERTDVNEYYGISGNHGFETTVKTERLGTQDVYIYAINSYGGGRNLEIGRKTVNISGNTPQANVELIEGGNGEIKIRGWAFDRDDLSKPVELHVYIGAPSTIAGGEFHSGIMADLERVDVNQFYEISGNHGFETTVKTERIGTQDIYVYAINSYGGGQNIEIGRNTVTITGTDPQGTVDIIEGGHGEVKVRGWAFDADDSSKPVELHIYIGGPSVIDGEGHTGIMADKERLDVNEAYGISGNHGFDTSIRTSRLGKQDVYVYAINTHGGGSNNLIGQKAVTISESIPVSSVKLSQSSISIKVGETKSIIATVLPDNATDKSISWNSSNNDIATVENGVISANSPGTTFITAKAGEKSSTCEVTVTAQTYSITYNSNGGSGTMESISVTDGESITLPACTIAPPDRMGFKAWSYNNTEYLPGTSFTVTGNITFTAIWEEINIPNQILSVTKTSNGANAEIYCSDTTATVICATYDNRGRMLKVESQSVKAGQNTYSFTVGSADTIKVFVIDARYCPVCESKSV